SEGVRYAGRRLSDRPRHAVPSTAGPVSRVVRESEDANCSIESVVPHSSFTHVRLLPILGRPSDQIVLVPAPLGGGPEQDQPRRRDPGGGRRRLFEVPEGDSAVLRCSGLALPDGLALSLDGTIGLLECLPRISVRRNRLGRWARWRRPAPQPPKEDRDDDRQEAIVLGRFTAGSGRLDPGW